ncbi:hypothetical protein [Novosphingobium sp. ST904]|uniref:hypothetical protein n=1 Tax=Novosphingobium sp. ST904 TaxID=1684385 RepID=UPI0006C8471B|nr:hypothetical protein [Novosphingobium sp. ST904]KPH63369.1 hypothetical protein ADT71_13750 [Novosphingobium sp. ST904]
MQSSALSDGLFQLHQSSIPTAAAHPLIGKREQHHRHLGAFRSRSVKSPVRKQDIALSVVDGLH